MARIINVKTIVFASSNLGKPSEKSVFLSDIGQRGGGGVQPESKNFR